MVSIVLHLFFILSYANKIYVYWVWFNTGTFFRSGLIKRCLYCMYIRIRYCWVLVTIYKYLFVIWHCHTNGLCQWYYHKYSCIFTLQIHNTHCIINHHKMNNSWIRIICSFSPFLYFILQQKQKQSHWAKILIIALIDIQKMLKNIYKKNFIQLQK